MSSQVPGRPRITFDDHRTLQDVGPDDPLLPPSARLAETASAPPGGHRPAGPGESPTAPSSPQPSPVQEEPPLDWTRAEALRKAGEFARAGKAFHEVWNRNQSSAAGWRYAYCLRKAGYPEPALRAALQVVRTHPDDHWARQELHWCLYFARLKPAVQADNSERILQAAREMVRAGAEGMALEMAVFAAVRAAKAKGHWGEVARWTEALDPEALSAESTRGPQGRPLPSPRERYWFARLKSLVEVQRWGDALDAAQQACQQFPSNLDFRRWRAQALAGVGDLAEAVALLEPLRSDRRARWYHLADLALFLRGCGRLEDSWAVGQEALRMPAEDQARVTLLATLARTAADLGRLAEAADLLGWSLALRREQGWPLPPPLVDLRGRLAADLADAVPEWDLPSAHWRRECLPGLPAGPRGAPPSSGRRSRRPDGPVEDFPPGREGPSGRGRSHAGPGGNPGSSPSCGTPQSQAAPAESLPAPGADGRHRGVVTGYREGQPFAFLRLPGGARVFALAADLPEPCRRDGAAATFAAVSNFDRKKNRQSWRASQVRAVEEK